VISSALIWFAATMSGNKDYKSATSIYDFTVNSIKGEEVPLSKYNGHVCLIVNVASKCGLTPTNYKELNELYDEYAESKGLRILAFPCNQFNGQEPGDSEEICSFADRQKVKFDLFEKIDVNGDKTHPLWSYLKKEKGGLLGNFIKWNFTKFIVDKEGKVVERHGPNVDPHKLKGSLEKYF
jgi:phospholipid-hydroperoxide glutathione peroxidase